MNCVLFLEQHQKEDQSLLVDTNIHKEMKTLVEQNVAEITLLENPKNVLDVPEKDDYDMYKETAAKTRRKSSFKIDLQEIKELDRKLSLKISEIERASFEKRRSIIGISPPSQGDIDSQVLFSFDRDYIKEEELSRNQSSETEENESHINARSQTETIPEGLSIGECIQISVNFIEQEKLYNVVASCDINEAVNEVSHTNNLLENMNEKLLETFEKSVGGELKDSRPASETNYAFKDSYKLEFEDQIISGNNDDIFNKLSEEQSSKIEINEKVTIQTDNNSETSYLILSSNEEHVASIDRVEVNQNENSDHILRTSLIPDEKDSLSPKESEFKYIFHDQDLSFTNSENQPNIQVKKSPQISGTLSPENKSYFDKSPSCRNTLLPSEYETLKLSAEDVPDIEEEQIKHQAARRGSEIALSMILEENLQILSKFQQSKKSSILVDKEGCDEGVSLPESFTFTKQSEYFNLSKENEDEMQSVNSGNAQLSDSTLHETDSYQLSNMKTKVSSSHLTDEPFQTFSDFSWFSEEKKLIHKDNLKSVLKDFTSETNVQKENDIIGVKNLKFENEDHTLESYTKSSFPQYKYKYDVKDEEEDFFKDETKVVENFSIEREMAKSEPFEKSLLQKDITDNSKLLLKNEGNFESLELNYGTLTNKVKYELKDFLKEEEHKEVGKHGTEREQIKSDVYEPSLNTKDKDKDKGTLLYKDEDNFDSSEFRYETLRSKSKYDPVTSKLFCRRQTSLDYSPKSKLSGFSFQGNNERRTSLSLDSGTTLKEESRRTSTTEREGETDISNFSSFKFYSPVISELEYKHENFNDTSPIRDVASTKENSRITTEEETLTYSKRLAFTDTIDRNEKEGHLTDTFDLELQSHSGERLKKECFYSDFKVSDTIDITEIKTDKLYKPTFSFDCDNQDKEYKPRYSSLSPRRRILVDVDMEPNYLSVERLSRSASPSKFSTSHFDTGFSVTDEKLKASSYRLSTLKSEKGTDCDTKDSDTKFMCDNLDIKLRLGNKSTSESTNESYEHTKSSDIYPGSSPTSPTRFNPFPSRTLSRQPKELGVKLGLYQPPKSDKSPSKRFS